MFQKITRKKLELFLEKHSSDEEVLDVGSGGSTYDKYFPNRITVDIDPERKPDIVADAHKLPFPDNHFNKVLCTEVLEHVESPEKVLSEILRVLTPGGTLILTTRFVYPIHDSPNDYWRFTYYGMKKLFKNWKILELNEELGSFSTMAALFQRICFQNRLRFNHLSKIIIFSISYILNKLDFLIVESFGDIKKTKKVDNFMTTGYYIVAKKIN